MTIGLRRRKYTTKNILSSSFYDIKSKKNVVFRLKVAIVDGAQKKKSAKKRRVVACPFELLRQFVAKRVTAVDNMRRAACNASVLI